MVNNLDGPPNRGNKQIYVIIIDFAKVFGKVSHGILLYKLDYYGIREDLLMSGSTHGSLRALKSGVGWSSIRYSPGPIWCPSGFGLRTGLFSYFHQ